LHQIPVERGRAGTSRPAGAGSNQGRGRTAAQALGPDQRWGAELVNQALGTKAPIIAINSLGTDTEISEQKGFGNLLIGLFGAVRNPAAHAPKVIWPMPEQDTLDIFALVSFVHRKLDGSAKV
jgi:uncharacterized protein (TIGR02391 family)